MEFKNLMQIYAYFIFYLFFRIVSLTSLLTSKIQCLLHQVDKTMVLKPTHCDLNRKQCIQFIFKLVNQGNLRWKSVGGGRLGVTYGAELL